jgi:hypothetical protein
MPFDFGAPAAEIESRRVSELQCMPSVEASRAQQTFQPIRFVFPMRPQPCEWANSGSISFKLTARWLEKGMLQAMVSIFVNVGRILPPLLKLLLSQRYVRRCGFAPYVPREIQVMIRVLKPYLQFAFIEFAW